MCSGLMYFLCWQHMLDPLAHLPCMDVQKWGWPLGILFPGYKKYFAYNKLVDLSINGSSIFSATYVLTLREFLEWIRPCNR